MPLLVTCRCQSQLMRHCFLGRWTCQRVSEGLPFRVEMSPFLCIPHMYSVLCALIWRSMPVVAHSKLYSWNQKDWYDKNNQTIVLLEEKFARYTPFLFGDLCKFHILFSYIPIWELISPSKVVFGNMSDIHGTIEWDDCCEGVAIKCSTHSRLDFLYAI